MTETDHCAENALAERMNGILKQEYGLGERMKTKAQARQMAEQAVWLYNTQRPHTALGLEVPQAVHQPTGLRPTGIPVSRRGADPAADAADLN